MVKDKKLERKLLGEWQCSWCLRTYTFEELRKLETVKAVDSDVNPLAPDGHGYVSKCVCGKVFHKDKWMMQQHVGQFWVSTVHLELSHMGLYYETMVFDTSKKKTFNLKGIASELSQVIASVSKELVDAVSDKDVTTIGKECMMDRYATRDEAIAGHRAAVTRVKAGEFGEVVGKIEDDVAVPVIDYGSVCPLCGFNHDDSGCILV